MQKMNDTEGAIAIFGEIATTYRSENEETLDVVLAAKVNRASLRIVLGYRQEGLDCLTDIISRYGHDDRPLLAPHLAHALIDMGSSQAEMPDTRRAGFETWRTVIDLFAGSADPSVRKHVANAYIKIVAFLTYHNFAEDAMATCEKAVEYIENGDDLEIRMRAQMLLVKGWTERSHGSVDRALATHDELDRRFGDIIGLGGLRWRWHVGRERVLTYYKAGMTDHWREMFRKLYATFDSGHGTMLLDLHETVVQLAAAGGPSNVLARELLADQERAQALWPLIVALLGHAGESVRAPAEVIEVADDILKEIEQRRLRNASHSAAPEPQAGHQQGGP